MTDKANEAVELLDKINAFVSCYVAHQIAVLTPKIAMNLKQKLFYCLCIQKNAYRFNYGRQADRTLRELVLPDSFPTWVEKTNMIEVSTANRKKIDRLNIQNWAKRCC